MEKRLNPGSDEALEVGCRCPGVFIHDIVAQKVIDSIYYIDGVITNNYIRSNDVWFVKSHLKHHFFRGSKRVWHLHNMRKRL